MPWGSEKPGAGVRFFWVGDTGKPSETPSFFCSKGRQPLASGNGKKWKLKKHPNFAQVVGGSEHQIGSVVGFMSVPGLSTFAGNIHVLKDGRSHGSKGSKPKLQEKTKPLIEDCSTPWDDIHCREMRVIHSSARIRSIDKPHLLDCIHFPAFCRFAVSKVQSKQFQGPCPLIQKQMHL